MHDYLHQYQCQPISCFKYLSYINGRILPPILGGNGFGAGSTSFGITVSPFTSQKAEGYAATTPAARRNLSFPGTPDPDEDYFTPNKRVQTSHCVASGGTVMGGPPMRPNMGRGTEPGVQVVRYDIASTLCCAAVGEEGWCMVPSAQCSVKAHCLFRQDRI